ncbi:hypothetical protein NRS6092_02937 [Bacillus subtilis]|nr:hypothetical protein C7M26_03612 [Bacillus subtilis]CAF1755772.1 hypothetical protein NRS6092_02937 [Bacillus subtilis]
MEAVYEHPFMTTWFIFWFFLCLDGITTKIKKVN